MCLPYLLVQAILQRCLEPFWRITSGGHPSIPLTRLLPDLEQLRIALERVEAARTAEQFSIADEAFHQSIAEACGNPLMIWIYEQVNEVRRHELWRASRGEVLSQQNMTQYNAHHRALFEAISQRDAQAAKAHMMEHLSKAREDLVR